MRGIGEAGRGAVSGVTLAEEGLQDVHDTAEEVRAAAHGSRADGFQERAFWDFDLQKIVEAVVDDAVGVVDSKQVVSSEHLEHGFREVEVNGSTTLRTCAIPVKDEFLALLLHGAFDSPGTNAMAIIVDEIGEEAFLVADFGVDEMGDGCSVSLQELVAGGVVDFDAVSVA